jgi:hypothetical protein
MKKKVFQQPTTKIVELGVCSMIAASAPTPPTTVPNDAIQGTHTNYGQNAWNNEVAWN